MLVRQVFKTIDRTINYNLVAQPMQFSRDDQGIPTIMSRPKDDADTRMTGQRKELLNPPTDPPTHFFHQRSNR